MYPLQVEKELQDICSSILQLLDDHLIPTASSGESKVFYLKMKVGTLKRGHYCGCFAACCGTFSWYKSWTNKQGAEGRQGGYHWCMQCLRTLAGCEVCVCTRGLRQPWPALWIHTQQYLATSERHKV